MKTRLYTSMLAISFALTMVPAAQAKTDTADKVSESDLRAHIAILASDEFGGRDPGTDGEVKTTDYIRDQWKAAGLLPAFGIDTPSSSWLQPVALITRKSLSGAMTVRQKPVITPEDILLLKTQNTVRGMAPPLVIKPEDIALRATHNKAAVKEAPMIYAHYGVNSDGAIPADVAGKLVFILFAEPAANDLKDSALTSYRVRREKILDAGAAAVIGIVGYDVPWTAIKSNFASGQMALATAEATDAKVRIDGLVGMDTASRIFQSGGANMADIMLASKDIDAAAVPVAARIDLTVDSDNKRITSHNVLGYIPAKTPTKETILLLGHWDHLGVCRPEGTADRICNGAVDNASGIAVLIEVAKRLGKGPAMDRNILFMATTAEERGLLGAYAFAANPPAEFPLNGIVAALNVDTIAIGDRGTPVAIIGRGNSNLDKAIDKVARKLGRKNDMDLDANAFVRRQDGWALGAKGVPSVMIGGSFSDLPKLEAFLGSTYHGPEDELVDSIPLGGAAEDADLHVALVRYLANRKSWKKTEVSPSFSP